MFIKFYTDALDITIWEGSSSYIHSSRFQCLHRQHNGQLCPGARIRSAQIHGGSKKGTAKYVPFIENTTRNYFLHLFCVLIHQRRDLISINLRRN